MKYTICISGTADGSICTPETIKKIKQVGKEIIKNKGVLVTGATTGAPDWAAEGAKESKGFSIGVSPASSELEHVKKYQLPLRNYDMIMYTGFGYSGRNLLLTRSSDAVIIVSGRMGTLNEFTIAFEDNKPIGILVGSGGTADQIKEIVAKANRGPGKIVYEEDPKKLVQKVVTLIRKEKQRNR